MMMMVMVQQENKDTCTTHACTETHTHSLPWKNILNQVKWAKMYLKIEKYSSLKLWMWYFSLIKCFSTLYTFISKKKKIANIFCFRATWKGETWYLSPPCCVQYHLRQNILMTMTMTILIMKQTLAGVISSSPATVVSLLKSSFSLFVLTTALEKWVENQ